MRNFKEIEQKEKDSELLNVSKIFLNQILTLGAGSGERSLLENQN